jgi:DNA-binding MarR family transcriptional regulator
MVEYVNYFITTMFQEADLKRYYLNFINFLLQQKHVLVDIGLRHELTSMQTLALLLLENPLPMSSLTAALGCDASNVTGIIDGLQHKNLVKRIENPEDRRVRMLVLSQTGMKLRDKLFEQLIDEVDPNPIFSKLSLQELKTFFQLVDKVTQ